MNINNRPITSKARGICKYYTTERGCYAGKNCKFLHSNEPAVDPSGSRPAILTPYDQNKRCRHFANGSYCKRGDKCWFLHFVDPKQAGVDDAEPCSICLEQPLTYGLLVGCSHIFCTDCIRRWRDPSKNVDGNVENAKKCPMCRTTSPYIIPSSRFWKDGQEEKTKVVESYKATMSHVDCKYFALSLGRNPQKPTCPFGKDCFYRHSNLDGTPHLLEHGIQTSLRNWQRRRNLPRLNTGNQDAYTNIINFLDRVVAEFVEATSPEVPERGGGGRSRSRTRNNDATSSQATMDVVAAAIRDQLDNIGWGAASHHTIPASNNWHLDASRDTGWGWNDDSATDASHDTDDTLPPMIWAMNGEADDTSWPVWNDALANTDADPQLTRQLESLADQMLGSQHTEQGDDTEPSPDSHPPLELIRVSQSADDGGGHDLETPVLECPVPEPTCGEVEGAPPSAIESQTPEDVAVEVREPNSHDISGVPPFVTDGRGRVVWSNKDAQRPTAEESQS